MRKFFSIERRMSHASEDEKNFFPIRKLFFLSCAPTETQLQSPSAEMSWDGMNAGDERGQWDGESLSAKVSVQPP